MKNTISKINILYILNATTIYGGANKSFLNLIEGIDKLIYNPIVLVPDNHGITIILKKMGIEVICVKYFQDIYPLSKSIRNVMLFIPNLIRYRIVNYFALTKVFNRIRELDISLIHTNVGTLQIGFKLAKRMNVPHVWHIREYQDKDFGFKFYPSKFIFKSLLKKNDYNITITQNLLDYFHLSNDYSKVIYNGIKSVEKKVYFEEKEAYFLFAGRLEPNKGLHSLLKAFNKYIKEGRSSFNLYVAGDSNDINYINSLKKFVLENGIDNRVKFLGMRDDIDFLMQKAKALIVSSPNEGFGRITVEAMFNGCLVIGYNNAGTAEILKGKKYGFLYKNEDELISFMKELEFKNSSDYCELVRLAHNDLYMYSNEKYVEETMKIYSKIV